MNGFPSLNRVTIWIENLKEYKKTWELMLGMNPSKYILPWQGISKEDLEKNIHRLDRVELYSLR